MPTRLRARHANAHERVRQLSRARSLVARNVRVGRETNSQVSADDGNPAVRGVVAKLDRGRNGSYFGEYFSERSL